MDFNESNQKRITGLEQASDGKGGCFFQVKGTTRARDYEAGKGKGF